MNHETLLQSSNALHQYNGDDNENDDEHVSALRHFPMHLVEYRLYVCWRYVSVHDMCNSCGYGAWDRCRRGPNFSEYCGCATHLILHSQEKMSYPTDLERRIEGILHRDRGNVTVHAPTSAQTFILFSFGLVVGFMVANVCAPLHSTKTVAHKQPWRIRYATSDGR